MDLTTAHDSNIFDFATEQARTIVHLHYFDLAVCAVIAGIVIGLLTYVAIKFRYRAGDAEPKQDPGNVKLETLWTVIPALILLVLGILTAIVMHEVNPEVVPDKPDIIVIAHQWWWEYRYPKTGVVTANELMLPEGVNSLLEIDSADVVHSFWVPDFGQKMDAIPGHPNHLFFKPIKLGLFAGACSEYCGADHSLMRIFAKVVPKEEFEAWTQSQLKLPVPAGDRSSQNGKTLFMTNTCMQCHSIAGTEAKGKIGPDLTHISSRHTLGSAIVANNTKNLAAWIQNPQQFKPGCHMPKMRLSENDAHDIAVYLENLK